jgi:23S rRNA pseudouridine1911/1915/1917 synthase
MPTLTVGPENAGQRLDVFITSHMALSRSQVQKLIKAGTITINNEPAKTKTVLEEGHQIDYPEMEVQQVEKTGSAPILDIVYEDDDMLVINKPAGLLVHDAFEQETRPTVVDALLERYPDIAEIGDDPKRPGIVHRLDMDVSGLMAIAKTQEAFEFLKGQFQERTVKKEYTALVYGRPPHIHDTIELKIARSKSKGRMVSRTGEQEGKEAITKYDTVEEYNHTTLLKVNILTGRTHQIRVHMQAIGCPIVGDKLYKIKRMKVNPIELGRIFLHAHKLEIKSLDGTTRQFESELPVELEQFLNSHN